MILQSLVRYYEDLLQQNDKKPVDERIPKLGWCLAGVSYMIELKEDGTIKQIISLKEEKIWKENGLETTNFLRTRNAFEKWKMSTIIFPM